ncbi:MAG: tetratricopeptide repeat protein [Hyphomicrobiaceae bacterium]|nr:tetratricopeptide repeat protein [Hyphomicrobiaceae bacterium]
MKPSLALFSALMTTALLGFSPSAFAGPVQRTSDHNHENQNSTAGDIAAYDDWYEEAPMLHKSHRNRPQQNIDLTTSIRAQQVWTQCKNAARKQAHNAILICLQATRIDPDNPYIWNAIGGLHEQKKDRGQALEAYTKMLKVAILQGNPAAQILSLGNLAHNSQKCERSKAFARKAIDLAITEKRQDLAIQPTNILAICLSRRQKYKMAEKFLKTALKFASRYDRKIDGAKTMDNLAAINIKMGQLAKAKYYYGKSLKFYENLNRRLDIAASYYRLGRVSAMLRDYTVAEHYLLISLKKFKAARYEKGILLAARNIRAISRKRHNKSRDLPHRNKELRRYESRLQENQEQFGSLYRKTKQASTSWVDFE